MPLRVQTSHRYSLSQLTQLAQIPRMGVLARVQ